MPQDADTQLIEKKCRRPPGGATPRFWSDVDNRLVCVKRIKRRLEKLRAGGGIDSYEKELLAQRACFLSLHIEELERDSVEGKPIDKGSYVQAVNCLMGILRVLGLGNRTAAKRRSLRDIIKEHDEKDSE